MINWIETVQVKFMKKALVPMAILLSILDVQVQADCCLPYETPILTFAPPAKFGSECSFEGHIDYLYLKAKIVGDGFFYSAETEVSKTLANDGLLANDGQVSNNSHKEVYIDWDVGYNIGIGWTLPCDQWAINANWLHFNSNSSFDLPFSASNSMILQTVIDTDILNNYGPGSNLSNYSFGEIGLGLHLNLLDLTLSRKFAVGPSVWLRPKAGILALFIQDEVSYALQAIPNSSDKGAFFKASQHIEGAGILFGLDSEWDLCCGLSVYGGVDFGAVAYRLNLHQMASISRGFSPGGRYKVDQFDPLFRYKLGGAWEMPLCQNTMSLSLGLGWEAFFLLNHDHFVRFAFSEAKPLVLQGLSFRIALSI